MYPASRINLKACAAEVILEERIVGLFIDGFDSEFALVPMDNEESHGEPEIVLDPEDCPEMYFDSDDIAGEILDAESFDYWQMLYAEGLVEIEE